MTAPESPRVRRLVVFKHGVAYVERAGPADGPFTLSFKREEMNDVLKSLAVWVAEGEGTVGAVAFEADEELVGEVVELLLEGLSQSSVLLLAEAPLIAWSSKVSVTLQP